MSDEYIEQDRILGPDGFPIEQKKSAKVEPLPVVTVPNPFFGVKQEAPVTYSGKAEYKVRWRQDNREHYLKKNREYVARCRQKKANS